MADQQGGENGSGRRPPDKSRGRGGPRGPIPPGPRPGGRPRPGGTRSSPGPIGLTRKGGDNFELVHPRCVNETELDFEEGIELWKAGDPESARDALRYALSACHDNMWAHVALGQIALVEFRDPTLARGHFGYAFDLAHRALPPGFNGQLRRDRPNNRPFYEAIDGLVASLEALGRHDDSKRLRALASRLSGGTD
jgi:hypothetical protein